MLIKMDFDFNKQKYVRLLVKNATNQDFEANDKLFLDIERDMKLKKLNFMELQMKMSNMNNEFKEIKNIYKKLKPKLCDGCVLFKSKELFNSRWPNQNSCDDCMAKKRIQKRKLKLKEKHQEEKEQMVTYSITDCKKLYQQLFNEVTIRCVIFQELKTDIIKFTNKYPINELVNEVKKYEDISEWFRECLNAPWSKENDKTHFTNLGNLLLQLIKKVNKYRKLTDKEIRKRDIEEDPNSSNDEVSDIDVSDIEESV